MKVALQVAIFVFIISSISSLPNVKDDIKAGCCPVIDKSHSVIQSYGYKCSAAITVSAGTCSDKDQFVYVVDWGDGAETKGQESGIGPFQVEHQYALKAASYQVNVKFCSQGDGCCDSLSKIISVPANSSSEAL